MGEADTVTRAPAPLQQQSSMAILFADVSGSTRLYETQGDAKARRMIGRCVELMTESTLKHGGALIKTIGDEVMCRFAAADDAAAAALDMQEQVSGAAMTGGGGGMAIHVGFHFGPVVEEDKDVFGDAVNVASRMVNLSKRDQILTTGATVERLSPKWRAAMRQVDRAAVRGKSEEIDVYELVWQEAEATRIAGDAGEPSCADAGMSGDQATSVSLRASASSTSCPGELNPITRAVSQPTRAGVTMCPTSPPPLKMPMVKPRRAGSSRVIRETAGGW